MRSLVLACALTSLAWGQHAAKPSQNSPQEAQQQPVDDDASYSSSRSHIIDLSPPKDDAKNHPDSASVNEDVSDVQEFQKWDPMRAMKAVEVGDFYFKRKNYQAALSRYEEALEWKSNDAVATFRLAQCEEKLNKPEVARENYEAYLKILPGGPLAEEAQQALDRLKASSDASKPIPQSK